MARLTWQNVDAPDLGRAADILNAAANQIGSAGTTISGAARQFQQDRMDRRSAAVLPILAGVSSSGDVAGALDEISKIARPEDLNDEARKAVLGLMGQGLDYDATRAGTAAVRGSENRSQQTFDRQIAREDQAASVAKGIQERIDGGRYGPQGGRGANGLPDNERDLLALTLQAEAGGEGYNGMLAAGSVVANRVKSGKYGVGFGGVITRPGQFSYLNGVTGYANGEGAIDPSSIRISDDAYAAADAIMSGNYVDPTGGATHYYNDKVADPAWGANKAGGEWVRVGNHIFGSPDGKAGTGSDSAPAQGVADLIPENNLLPPEFWQGAGNSVWSAEEEGYQRGRSREEDARADEERANLERAQALLDSAISKTQNPADLPAIIGQSDAPPKVKAAALAGVDTPYVQSQFALTDDPNRPQLPGAVEANKALDETQTMIDTFQNSNPTLRIQGNAKQYDNDPAVTLATQLGDETDEGKALALEAINQVVSDSAKAGITVTPGEAASLLRETAERAGISALAPGGQDWGGIYTDPARAVALATAHLSDEQRRKSANDKTDIENAQAEITATRERAAKEQQQWQLAVQRGNEEAASKHEKNFNAAMERALKLEGNIPFLRKNETPTGVSAGGGEPTSGATSKTPTATAPAADPIQQATMQIAAGAIVQGTGGAITLERLAGEPPEIQLQMIETALQNLKREGGSSEQIMALESIKEDVLASNLR